MRFVFLAAWSAVLMVGCSASHAPDHCDEPWKVDFDRRACADLVDEDSDPAGEGDAGGRRPRRDASVRDAGFDPELDGDGPCRVGVTRKCQCSSGAYSEQSCTLDRSWSVCACDGRPPLVFGDAAVPRDASRPRPDASARDAGGAADASVGPDANVDVLGPPLTYVPAAPATPVPDCRAPAPAARPARVARWLAYRAAPRADAPATLQLVELGETGPGFPAEAGPIDAVGALASWSSDGAQLAFTARAGRDSAPSVQLVTLPVAGADAQPTFVVAAPSASFVSWAPGLPRLAVRTADGSAPLLKALDTAAPLRELAALPLPAAGVERAYWSPDGRYLGRSANDATGLSFWDLSAPMPTAIAIDSSGRALSWSPDGKRFFYLRSGSTTTELMAVTFDGTVQSKQLVASNVYALGARLSEPAWLDADRIFWQEAGGELFVSDLRTEPPTRTALGLQPPYYSVSPGGVCLAYSGPCAAGGPQGVCVRRLDPAAAPVSAHLSNLPWGGVVWSQSGDQLALASPAGTLVEALNLDGQPFAPQLLARGREGQLVRNDMAWAPGLPARWLAFHAPGERQSLQTLSLWSVTSKKAFPVDLGDRSAQSLAWSPDGRDLALQSSWPSRGPAAAARLFVQRVTETELGPSWPVLGPDLPGVELGGGLFAFQP